MGDNDITSLSVMLWIAVCLLGLYWTLILVIHGYRILQPSIISYPWDKSSQESTKFTQTVVFAASYNPPHHGHIRMLEYLSTKYERVIAVVGFNPNKKYLVSPEERANLLREMLKSRSENVEVEGASSVLLWGAISEPIFCDWKPAD